MNTTRQQSKQANQRRINTKIGAISFVLTLFVLSPCTLANPAGGNIVGGDAHINHAGLTTNIHQHTDRLAIEWDTFNISNNEILNIDQPNRQSIILNRILDVNPSQINGQINANGQVIIANPNGVFFGENSSVNVGGLFAAALDVDPQEFMQGRINFKALENVQAVISNEGTLQVIDGGALVLLGQQIKNEGLLIANFGTVALVAGSDITVKFDDNSNLNIQINQNRLADILKLDDTQILNSGIIQAHGGNVVLTTTQASQIKTSIIKRDESRVFSFTTGTIVERNGEIFLAGPGGDIRNIGDVDVSDNADAGTIIFDAKNINNSGNIIADSNANGNAGNITLNADDTTLLTDNSLVSAQAKQNGNGGTVQVLGNQVGLTDNAQINASGANGGGEVLVGGDYQGKNENIKNAEAVYLGENTNIKADATNAGDGGKIIIWSDDRTRAYGSLSAKGAGEGSGGFIETSSKNYVDLQLSGVDVSAQSGLSGEWLIDPSNISIQAGGATDLVENPALTFTASQSNTSILRISTLENALNNGANVTVQTAVVLTCTGVGCTPIEENPEPGGGNITLADDLNLDNMSGDGTRSLTLRAHHNIIIDADIGELTTNNGTENEFLNLTLSADTNNSGGGDVLINPGRTISLVGGNFTVTSTTKNFVNSGTITTENSSAATPVGNVLITVAGAATLGNITTDANGGTLTVNATSIADGPADRIVNIAGTTSLTANSLIDFNNAGNDFVGDVTASSATISLTDTNTLTLNNITATTLNAIAGTGISQVNATTINLTGTSNFTTQSGNIDLQQANNLGTGITLNNNGAGNNNIVHINAVNLTANISGNLDISSGSDINDTGDINVAGTSDFRAPAGSSIILDRAGNTLGGTVQFLTNSAPGNLSNITLREDSVSGFTLQDNLLINGNLNLRARSLLLNNFTLANTATLTLTADTADIAQNNAITHAGTTILSASGNIDFNLANNFNNVQISNTATATINNDINSLDIVSVSNTGTLDIDAQGITQSGDITVTNLADLNAGTGSANLQNITATTLIVTANGITQSAASTQNISGTATFNAGSGAMTTNATSTLNATDLNITASAGITGSGTTAVSGTSTFDSAAAATTFNNIANDFNDVVITNAGTVTLVDDNNINLAGDMSSLNVSAGNGSSSTISNITDTAFNVSGTSTFTLVNGGDINLANFTNATRNNLQGTITILPNIGSVENVSIRNTGNIRLANLALNSNLNLDTLGNISQTDVFIIGGTSTFQANNITLLSNNVFNGDITLNDSNLVQITDTFNDTNITANNTIDLTLTSTGAVGIEGDLVNLNLNSNGNNITSTAGLLVTNNTTLNSGTGTVDFQANPVDLNNVTITQADTVLITDANNLTVNNATVSNLLDINAAGTVSVSGTIKTLDINTNNTITVSGQMGDLTALTTGGGIQNGAGALAVSGTARFDALGSDINLNNAANDFNALEISNAQDVNLQDANSITLQTLNARDLNLTTAGNITQSAGTQITSTRNAVLNSGNADITLTENNLFTALTLTANNATLVNNQALFLNDSVLTSSADISASNGSLSFNQITAANSITLTSDDALIDANAGTVNLITDTATLNAANGIGMASSINTQVNNLNALNTSNGDINIDNSGGDITLNAITNNATDTGNFNFLSTNDVFINNITLQQNLVEEFFDIGTGTVNLFTGNNGNFLGVGTGDINNPDITATNLRVIAPTGTFGSFNRPMVLDISGKVEITTFARLDITYAPPAPAADDIIESSIFDLTSGSVLTAVNGVQVTEVETLLDIDPAIFTQITHFVVEAEPLMLPRDQWFDDGYTPDDDDEYFRRIEGEEVVE